jgi:low affinity Fe/Cu permease
MLNKLFAIALFLVGIFLVIFAVFLYSNAWDIIWRLALGIVFIFGAVALANVESASKKRDEW